MKLNEIASVTLSPYSETQILVYIQTVYESSFNFIANTSDTLNDLLVKVDEVQSDEEKEILEKDRQIKDLNNQLNEADTKIEEAQIKQNQIREATNSIGNSLLEQGVSYDYSTPSTKNQKIKEGSIVRYENDFYMALAKYHLKDGIDPNKNPEYFFKIEQK